MGGIFKFRTNVTEERQLYDYNVQYIRTYYARCLRGRTESKDGIG